MPAPEPLHGQRVVAAPAALDALAGALPAGATVLRFAPDEALVVGAGAGAVTTSDPDAIVVEEAGFVALAVDRAVVERHVEWELPPAGGFAQGAIAGVPAKLAVLPDGRARIVTHAAYLADLEARLG